MSEHDRAGSDGDHVGSQPCRIRRAVALVETNFGAKLSRKEMARAAGLSVSHFSKYLPCASAPPRTNTWCVADYVTPRSSC